MRTEQEILNDIQAQQKRLEELCGPSMFGIYVKYNNEYDSKGNLVRMVMDPEVAKCYDELKKLHDEYMSCGYARRYDRGEYGGGTPGGY